MDAISALLQGILDFLNKAVEVFRRPDFTNGTTLFLDPNKSEGCQIEVPRSWSDGWTLRIQPTDQFFSITSAEAVKARLYYSVQASGGIVMNHARAVRYYLGGSYLNSPDVSLTWLPVQLCSEAIGVKGNKIFLNLFFKTTGTARRPIAISICKGYPAMKPKTVLPHIRAGGASPYGVSIPLFSKQFRLMTQDDGTDLTDLGPITQVDMNNNVIATISTAELKLLSDEFTFDNAGGPIAISKMSKFIPLNPETTGIQLANSGITTDLLVEFNIYE